ncbi:hypothetical protein [Kingella kingae]|uniref:hypothetical protein n=1 Tax=Kingella kingae TaxID=504 RepID=UPI000DFB6F3C|nr:hypothetical protein [Kingella kingae]MBD3613378.1 hypothetical protein [Kingella kingae]MBD3631737.1 hypothetical protein [Kingella kingae]MBD3659089.1 hypothetical protein [Kingella kingae]QIF42028.1 hypothetical protein GB851_08335 [Kingella kingae]QIP47996.1 hypothetical protein HBA47_08720 [Kingella kingae]
MRLTHSALALALAFSFGNFAHANTLACSNSYGFRVDVSGNTGATVCSNTSSDLIDLVKDFSLSNSGYTQSSAAFAVGRINDVDFTASYAANSNDLVFNAPDLGIENKVFTGATRKKAQDAFEDWVKHSGIIGDMMRYQSKHSAASPITGAAGIMPTMAATDFNTEIQSVSNIATTPSSSTDNKESTTNADATPINNLIGTGVSIGSFSNNGERINSYTLPLSYSIGTGDDSRQQLIISVPLTMYTIGKAKGYHAGVGIAHRFPITQNWTLTPGIRYALTGSVDRATIASVTSASLTSTYHIPFEQFDLNIANMIGYYRTGKFKAGDYSFDPDIKQTMLRNGVMLSQPITLGSQQLAIEYSLIDTRYIGGQKPFMRDMQEFGVTLGTHRNNNSHQSFLRAGVSYIRAKDNNGFTFNFGYWF